MLLDMSRRIQREIQRQTVNDIRQDWLNKSKTQETEAMSNEQLEAIQNRLNNLEIQHQSFAQTTSKAMEKLLRFFDDNNTSSNGFLERNEYLLDQKDLTEKVDKLTSKTDSANQLAKDLREEIYRLETDHGRLFTLYESEVKRLSDLQDNCTDLASRVNAITGTTEKRESSIQKDLLGISQQSFSSHLELSNRIALLEAQLSKSIHLTQALVEGILERLNK